ncbi:hypothetical protein KBY82_05325 [Cyanobium sp. AMD-g]|nr:hypothetical protein [Cyanobium sp. AMD-g]
MVFERQAWCRRAPGACTTLPTDGEAHAGTTGDHVRIHPANDGGEEMKKILKVIGLLFLSIDTVVTLSFLYWALTASTRDGEVAYAFVFLLFSLAYIGIGGGALVFSAKRGSVLGLWFSTVFLGLPPVLFAAIRISNSL